MLSRLYRLLDIIGESIAFDMGKQAETAEPCGTCECTQPVPDEYPPAVIGGTGNSGVWQPTGPLFEVMYQLTDTFGQFYIRERKQR